MVDFMTWEEENGHTFKKKKLKYIVSTPITDGPHETPELLDEGIPFLSAESVKNGILDFNYKRGYISLSDHKLFCKKVRPQKNDIFIVKSGATTGNCGIVTTDEEFSIWSPLALIRCDNISVLQKFIYYYSLCYSFTHQVEQSWSYGTQQNIGMGVLGNLYVTLPSSKEQQSIVDYLDKACAQIDSIAADLEKQIALLQKYKKPLITETVTKGLDKSVPMKDSGVEWIGEIPNTWDCKKMKYVISEPLQYGANEAGDDYKEDYPRYIRITDITEENSLKDDGKLSLSPDIAKPYLLKDGDLLFARSGATVGKTFYYTSNYGTCAFAGYLIKARFNQDKMNPKFVYYTTLGIGYENWKNTVFTQATIQNIGADKYAQLYITVPSMKEQNEIIAYLDTQCKAIDDVIHSKYQQLSTIQQHKKSLIYEYVTGKKRVKEVR